MTKLAFIGAGNMTKSMVVGLVNDGFNADDIMVSNPSAEKRLSMAKDFGINQTDDNCVAANFADIVILSVKPHFIKDVAKQISTTENIEQKCVISVAAGVTIAQIQSGLSASIATVRAMPNTPSLIGLGMTGAYASNEVSNEQRQQANKILTSIGKVMWLDEEQKIDALLAVSGSGPAYFFYFMEAMQQKAVDLGFGETDARLLVAQTAIGAASMVNQSTVEISQLRHNVTSKGGTTQAALTTFEQGELLTLVSKAMQAAQDRAKEIAQSNN